MSVPENCKYTKEHEWIRMEGETAVMGITHFAQDELGEIVFIELPDAGTSVGKSDSLCVVESTKAASDVYAPISGTIESVNEQLSDAPDKVNSSPYEDGWMVKLTGINQAELDELMDAEAYQAFLAG